MHIQSKFSSLFKTTALYIFNRPNEANYIIKFLRFTCNVVDVNVTVNYYSKKYIFSKLRNNSKPEIISSTETTALHSYANKNHFFQKQFGLYLRQNFI